MQTTTKKVKEGTRGQKQIIKENEETISFYKKLVSGINIAFFLIKLSFSTFTVTDTLLTIFGVACYIGCYQFMVYMARIKTSETGAVIDSGVDLNMGDGVAEHVKDIMILTAGCQLLSVISNYFWLLWLLAPGRGFWLLWKSVLSPYFFQEGPVNQEMDEKKQRKAERKMKRQNR